VRIDSESESEDGLSSASAETVGAEADRRGSSAFLPSPDFVTVSKGSGGTGGRLCEASIGGGGGAKGGNLNENGTFRTCRNMAEAYAGQMAENWFHTTAIHHVNWRNQVKCLGVDDVPVGLIFTNRVSNTE